MSVYSQQFAGVHSLPVHKLQLPPQHLQVREVKEWYVDYLVGMLSEEKDDHEDLTAPLLVIASADKERMQVKRAMRVWR